MPGVACSALPVDGAVVVVPAGGGGRVVATDPGGGLGGGAALVLGRDGGGEQHCLEHSTLLSPVLAMLHVLRLAFLLVPLAHLLESKTIRLFGSFCATEVYVSSTFISCPSKTKRPHSRFQEFISNA